MNVLMIGLPFTGHINPSLGLSKAFIDGGHNVTFILTDYWKEAVIKTGAKFVAYDKFPDNPTSFDLRRLTFKAAYDTALRIGKGFDVVIYDVLFFLGKNLSDKLKLPAIRLFSTFALNDALLEQIVDTGGPLMGLFKSKAIRKAITEKIIGDIALNNDDLLSEITRNTPALTLYLRRESFKLIVIAFQTRISNLLARQSQNVVASAT